MSRGKGVPMKDYFIVGGLAVIGGIFIFVPILFVALL